jgi:hypothetical protein
LDETVYHVLLEGRAVGPYDRRTIVGMRIKKTLTSDHVLISTEGAQLTVADLIGRRPVQPFTPDRSGGSSSAFSASLLEVDGPGLSIPRFKDEVQARVQADVLRLAGRFRRRLGWKEGRVKIVLKDVAHARVKGSQVELWLRNAPDTRLQRVALEFFTPETAGEFAGWLPQTTPFAEPAAVGSAPVVRAAVASFRAPSTPGGLWVAVLGASLVVALMLMVLMLRRVY